MESPTDFDLEVWEKDAKRLVMCTGCYGVGQRQAWGQDNWTLCAQCNGDGRSAAEMHTLALIAEVRRLRGEHAALFSVGAMAMQRKIAASLAASYDSGAANIAMSVTLDAIT